MKQNNTKKYQTPMTTVVPVALESVLLTGTGAPSSTGPGATFISDPDIEEE